MKVRYCDTPAPSNGGALCSGDSMILETCQDRVCSNTGTGTGNGGAYVNVRTCSSVFSVPCKYVTLG